MRIGVDIGGTNIRMGVVDSGKILKLLEEPCKADKSEEETVDHLKRMLRGVVNTNVIGIGIGVPSVVDLEHGIVYNAVNIPSWKEVHLKEILEKEFNIKVVINNDCNCFALGEQRFGDGTEFRHLVGVAMGTGLGAGIIIDGKLYCGNNNGAGEIGSMPYLNHDYEHYCSSHFFAEEHHTTAKEVALKVIQSDPQAISIMNEFGEHMGNMLKTILFTYDPQAIVLGGGIARAYHLFAAKMTEVLHTFPYPEIVRRLTLIQSRTENVGLLGAAALI